MTEAETAFAKLTDPDGEPLGGQLAILLVPVELRTTGSELMTSNLVVTGENATRPDNNIWQGRYRLESSVYMSNANYTGNSALAWYLLSAPGDIPVIEVGFLNGQQTPTVQTAEADFSSLGIQMRGFHDFGVELQEWRGGIRAKGEA